MKFFTKNGWLTRYALACGYVHLTEKDDATRVRMWCANSETGQYDVHVTKNGERLSWDCFGSLSAAREAYKKLVLEHCGALRYRFENHPDVRRSVIV
jgi:hypothetical protein